MFDEVWGELRERYGVAPVEFQKYWSGLGLSR
jgi:hypothetical protein